MSEANGSGGSIPLCAGEWGAAASTDRRVYPRASLVSGGSRGGLEGFVAGSACRVGGGRIPAALGGSIPGSGEWCPGGCLEGWGKGGWAIQSVGRRVSSGSGDGECWVSGIMPAICPQIVCSGFFGARMMNDPRRGDKSVQGPFRGQKRRSLSPSCSRIRVAADRCSRVATVRRVVAGTGSCRSRSVLGFRNNARYLPSDCP